MQETITPINFYFHRRDWIWQMFVDASLRWEWLYDLRVKLEPHI